MRQAFPHGAASCSAPSGQHSWNESGTCTTCGLSLGSLYGREACPRCGKTGGGHCYWCARNRYRRADRSGYFYPERVWLAPQDKDLPGIFTASDTEEPGRGFPCYVRLDDQEEGERCRACDQRRLDVGDGVDTLPFCGQCLKAYRMGYRAGQDVPRLRKEYQEDREANGYTGDDQLAHIDALYRDHRRGIEEVRAILGTRFNESVTDAARRVMARVGKLR